MFKKLPRRYNTDLLIYEAFYVSLRNSLIVALAPLAVFGFLIAIENYPKPEKFWSTVTTMMEIVFMFGFFINFLYYVYFIRLRKLYAFLLMVVLSCGIVAAIFFTDLEDVLSDAHQAVIVTSWFALLAVIFVVNKIGHFPDKESRYDHESWLYRHELAETHDEEEEADHEDGYLHTYIELPPEPPEDDEHV
jgi:hypothetical protein